MQENRPFPREVSVETTTPSFEEFKLGDIGLVEGRLAEGRSLPLRQELRRSQEVLLEGQSFQIDVKDDFSPREDGSAGESLFISLHREGARINIVIAVHYSKGNDRGGRAQVEILRNDSEGRLPKGLGIALYRKVLGLLSDLAHKRGVPVLDIIKRNPAHLDARQWHRIFDPVLAEHGYSMSNEGNSLEKIYLPERP